MICPKCDAINKDNAHVCQNCGIRLSGTAMRPGAKKTERRYLAVGTALALVIVLLLVLMITSFSCVCSGCHNGDEDDINTNVAGDDWAGDELVSESSVGSEYVSGADADLIDEAPVE